MTPLRQTRSQDPDHVVDLVGDEIQTEITRVVEKGKGLCQAMATCSHKRFPDSFFTDKECKERAASLLPILESNKCGCFPGIGSCGDPYCKSSWTHRGGVELLQEHPQPAWVTRPLHIWHWCLPQCFYQTRAVQRGKPCTRQNYQYHVKHSPRKHCWKHGEYNRTDKRCSWRVKVVHQQERRQWH